MRKRLSSKYAFLFKYVCRANGKWLDSESIFMPLETQSDDEGEGEGSIPRHYLPKLGAKIREVISEYGGGVFPKLNWTAPRVRLLSFPKKERTDSRTQHFYYPKLQMVHYIVHPQKISTSS